MRTFKIVGGPGPHTIKVVDSETGEPLEAKIRRLEIVAEHDKLMRVTIEGFAEVDLSAVDEDRPA